MLTAATLGMVLYGVYSILAAIVDLIWRSRLEAIACLAEVAFGLLLMLSAAFVRVRMPGGLALALGALLGLQALAIHTDVHLTGSVAVTFQMLRGGIAVLLVGLAFFGARAERGRLVKQSEDSQ
jgi:hypothetical protein